MTSRGVYRKQMRQYMSFVTQSGSKKLKKGYDVVNVQGGMSAWTGKVV